ncbi:hypothetical protein GCM10010129_67840 [Streptomyces fumigatiscleroticus]|nr:hypothetical protein GCM10010129_67840 [Streptomyces fumigatiscleroticus]
MLSVLVNSAQGASGPLAVRGWNAALARPRTGRPAPYRQSRPVPAARPRTGRAVPSRPPGPVLSAATARGQDSDVHGGPHSSSDGPGTPAPDDADEK